MRHSIMTAKIERRGVRVPVEFGTDVLDQMHVRSFATRAVVALGGDDTVASAREAFGASATLYSGYPVLDAQGTLLGVVMRRDLEQAQPTDAVRSLLTRAVVTIGEDATLREAVELMASERIGRLPVMARARPGEMIGVLSSSDVIRAYRKRIDEHQKAETHISLPLRVPRRTRVTRERVG
jgi:CBS domain-containing protein